MAGWLVYRPTNGAVPDKDRIPYDIGGCLVNGADADAAIAAAQTLLSRLAGPGVAASVAGWSAIQVNANDLSAQVENTTFQGEVLLPGTMLRGGGITV